MGPRIKDFILSISSFVFLIIIWQILNACQIIPAWVLPSPNETLVTFLELVGNGMLAKLLINSFLNIFPAFILSMAASLLLGVLIGINSVFRRIFLPFLAAMNSVPSLAWLPLIILFFGFTRQSIWTVVFISSFLKIIYSVVGGVRDVNQNWILVAQNLGLKKFETVIKVILPGALPQILNGLRLGFGSAWRSLIGAEMLVVTAGGLGKYIWMSQWTFKFDQVISGVVAIALIGILMEQLVFKRIERTTLVRWGMIQK